MKHWTRIALGGGTLALALASPAWALKSGKTPMGMPYVSGGIGQSELSSLHAKRGDYSLWVITAAMKSGAYLADVEVSVRDAKQRVVFKERLDGPWLFIDLPLGRYEVEASFNGETEKRSTTIHRGDHHQVFFYFKTGDETPPDVPERPAPSNPFGGEAKK
jgi:hypothetical protein